MKYTLDKETAKKFMLYKNGLIGPYKFTGKKGIVDYIRQVSVVQYDPVDVCGKSPEILLNSRVKGFKKPMLHELLYKDRALFDYHDKQMSIMLMSEWKYFDRTRRAFAERFPSKSDIAELSEYIYKVMEEKGEIASKDVPSSRKVDWFWAATGAHRAVLEALYLEGKIAISNKSAAIKYYNFAEKVIPKEFYLMAEPHKLDIDHIKWRIKRRIGALGLLWNRPSDAFLGIKGLKAEERKRAFNEMENSGEILPVYIEGIEDAFYMLKEDEPVLEYTGSGRRLNLRCELLAPLDNFLWDRKLTEKLWGFKYKWEIYTPETKRQYGYYVLPVLYGMDFIGRIELKRDTKEKVMIKKNFWPEAGVKLGKAKINAVEKAVKRLAVMNGVGYKHV